MTIKLTQLLWWFSGHSQQEVDTDHAYYGFQNPKNK